MPTLRWIALRMPVLLVVALLPAGCDSTELDPFLESDFNYSIGGYLDGGVDTQFVRVTPVRDSIALAPGSLDATVTLEHLATGQTATWRDSIFSYQGAGARAENIAHNFWSAAPILPLETYRFTVTRSDGATSRATVTLPDTFPQPIIDGNTIKIRGVERLADVVVEYRMLETLSRRIVTYAASYVHRAEPTQDEFWVFIDRTGDEDEIAARFIIARLQVLTIKVTVAAAGPDWPDLARVDTETLALPDVVSNVEEGLGYLGGVISKTFYWPGFEPSEGEGPVAKGQ